MDTSQVLENRYKSFINRETPWAFFTGLGDYIEYILSIPSLKKVVGQQLAIRDREYKKIEELEKESIIELQEAKKKLLEIIKDKNIDVSKFSQDLSFIPTNKPENETVLDQLEKFETGKVLISGFFSDNLEHFLFDIATNLLKLGYKEELKDFIVSNKGYAEHYGLSGNFYVTGNINGNFIFSKTLPLRYAQVDKVETARSIELWGSFEILMEFWVARNERKKNASGRQIIENLPNEDYKFGGKEGANIIYAVNDLKTMSENQAVSSKGLSFLDVEKFRTRTTTVHFKLFEAIQVEKNINTKTSNRIRTQALENVRERLWKKSVDRSIEEIRLSMKEVKDFLEEYRAEKEEQELFEQEEKWWKNNDRPTYKKETGTISLSNRTCKISPTAKNQIVVCEALFARPVGAWLQNYEIDHKLKGEENNPRALYDVAVGLNKKIKNELGVNKMIEVSMIKIRLRKELFES